MTSHTFTHIEDHLTQPHQAMQTKSNEVFFSASYASIVGLQMYNVHQKLFTLLAYLTTQQIENLIRASTEAFQSSKVTDHDTFIAMQEMRRNTITDAM